MTRSAGRGLTGVTCFVVLSVVVAFVPAVSGGGGAGATLAATQLEGVATAGPRVTMTLPPGLDGIEHAALVRAGAYGSHPVDLLIVGDSIALTLGEGLSVGAAGRLRGDDRRQRHPRVRPRPATRRSTTTAQATSGVHGCDQWRGLWPFLVARLRPQVVALGLGRWEVTDHLLDGQWVHIGRAGVGRST